MKKYLLTIIISLSVGFLLSCYVLDQYDKSPLNLPVFNESKTAYLIQQGVYSSYDSMVKNTSNLSDYIYSDVDGMYHVYVGMTLDDSNVSKLQEYFKDKKMNTIVKTTTLNDSDMINFVMQYDAILKETTDKSTIKEVIKQVLTKYKGV